MLVNCKACGKEIGKGVKKCVHCGADQRNFFSKHKIITGILALIIIGGIGSAMGSGGKTDPVQAPAVATTTTTPVTTPTPTPVKAKPVVEVIKVSAVDLAATYEANEVKADQTYKGKTADITGTVDNIGVVLGSTYVVLSAGKEFSITNIQCFFKDQAEITKVAELKKGDKVTIQGVIDGKSMNVSVNNCVLK